MSELKITNGNIDYRIPVVIPLREAAQRTGLSYDYLRRGCLTGRFTHVRAGSKILINLDRLVEYLEAGEQPK